MLYKLNLKIIVLHNLLFIYIYKLILNLMLFIQDKQGHRQFIISEREEI